MTFADLQREVGTESSSRFSYHLTQLTDQFVRRTEDGYTFTRAGWEVARAILRGTYDKSARLDTVRTAATCSECEAELVRTYEQGKFIIVCEACERMVTQYPFPVGGFENRTAAEHLQVFDTYVLHDLSQASEGVCPACLGPMETSLLRNATEKLDEENPHVRYDCERCGNILTESVEQRVLRHPAVVSFCYDHDIDLRETPHWRCDSLMDRQTTVVCDDPPRLQVMIQIDRHSIQLTLDHDLCIVEQQRK